MTVSEVLPDTPLDVAVIVTLPALAPVARPAAVIVAMLLPDDAHVTDAVRS